MATHGGQNSIGPFPLDDARYGLPFDRLNIGRIGHGWISHDGRWIRVYQNDSVALLAQRFAGLSTRVIEFTRLTNHNGACTEDENTLDISPFWHESSPLSVSLRITHGVNKRIKKLRCLVRAWTCFGMSLKAISGYIGTGNALQSAVEQ